MPLTLLMNVGTIYVYYSIINPDMPDEQFFHYLNQLPPSLHPDVLKYHRRADQVRTLTGKLLMQEAIERAGFDAAHMDSISYTSFKRPYIADHFDFNITHSGRCVACCAGSGGQWKVRNFAPGLGVPEDPATGSAAGPLAVHLARHGRIAFGQEIEISQGAEIGRPSTLHARAAGNADRIDAVEVAGGAVVVARGELDA